MGNMPDLPPGSPMEEFFEEFFKNRRGQGGRADRGGDPGSRPAADQLARFRLHHRSVRPRRHQQPRHRRCRRDQRHSQRRHQASRRTGRQGCQERSRAAARAPRQTAQGGEVRRQRQAAAWRMGDRHRQPVQPRRHGDRRHRLGAQPRHQFGAVRQLHPDRRRHQPRQFRRSAVQPQRRSRRRQHRDHFAVRRLDRHRLCGAVGSARSPSSTSSANTARRGAAGSACASSRSPTTSPKA